MTTVLYANTELVTVAWLKEKFTAGGVGVILPNDSTWADTGFIQVTPIGGTSTPLGLSSPVVSIDCWAIKPGSNKPPWGHANNLAATIWHMTLLSRPHRIILPNNYPPAQFYNASVITEPRRVPDPGSYARYNFNLQLDWAPVTQ